MSLFTATPKYLRPLAVLCAGVAVCSAQLLLPEEKGSGPQIAEGTPVMLLEPRSMAGDVSVLLPGARKTSFSAAKKSKVGFRHYRREEFRAEYPRGWKDFYIKGLEAARAHLKTLKPSYKRNSKRVIEYAVLKADHPLTATTIILPEFREMFSETLGEQLYIVVPSRDTIMVFPKLATSMPDYIEVLTDLYKDAIYPGSEEIFEATEDGFRVYGAFSPD